MTEGQVRIPSGCAISGIIDKKGNRFNGTDIIKSIALMHERSNGLGGGFAGSENGELARNSKFVFSEEIISQIRGKMVYIA